MATKLGAAGVRIELKDNSAYTVINTPKATAGVVGFAPKGELNKIQRLTSTADQDTYFGLGFNNSRYNQGLYAARAVLNAGGYVEYIRPYGEEIDVSKADKRDLKTDAFVVAFDRDAMNITKPAAGKKNANNTSLQVEYFAATRYKTDGAAHYGVTRKINNIAEAVAKNDNVDFSVDATDYATLSERSRGDTDMVLFALMNADPSSASRAYSSYKVTAINDQSDNGADRVVECSTNPGFIAGDIVYSPVGVDGTGTELLEFKVVNIVERKVFLAANNAATKSAVSANIEVLYYHDSENSATENKDYLNVKTAVAGRGSKLFGALTLTTEKLAVLKALPDGSEFTVYDSTQNPLPVRFQTGVGMAVTVAAGSNDAVTMTFTEEPTIYVGEVVTLSVSGVAKAKYTVTAVDKKTVKATLAEKLDAAYTVPGAGTVTIAEPATDWIDVSGANVTVASVADSIASLLTTEPFYYSAKVIVADVDTAKTTPFAESSKEVYVEQGSVFDFTAGDRVVIVRGSAKTEAALSAKTIIAASTVASVDGYNSKIVLNDVVGSNVATGVEYQVINLTTSNLCTFASKVSYVTEDATTEAADIYIIGNYSTAVTMDMQNNVAPIALGVCSTAFTYNKIGGKHIIETSEKVLMDSAVGATFVSLGLATIQYMDVNYTGKAIKVYDLTEEGEAIARLYLSVAYKYNGTLYEFEGTIVPYVYNGVQLSIEDTADSELTGSGVKFVLNDSGELDMFLEDNSYDLSGTVADGKPSSITSVMAFNTKDPAIIHGSVWSYDPKNNLSTSTIATAYSLFLDKDNSDVSFIVGAGMGVNNFGLKSYESLNTTVMQAVLNICELRKDCFALFDGVNEKDIEKALKKDILAARFPAQYGRWGAIYDARPVFYDSIVTMTNVECAPSVAMAALIVANRSDSIFWRPPAGKDNGNVPSAWCSTVRNKRQFNYPEDPDSDIARLSDIHVNPFRTTKDGMYAWMDYTMQMEDTAFNQIHVAMLIAGLHKIFYHYLDGMVFLLNTPALRSQIQGNIQAQLDYVTRSNPSGFEEAYCICDDTNNTQDVIQQKKLYVDLKLRPTSSIRFITLRSEVMSSGDGNTITTTMF